MHWPWLIAWMTAAAPSGLPVVALDAGHGGTQEGAVGICGLREKDLTLALAQRTGDILNASGRVRAVLLRSQDVLLPLEQRSARAHAAGAELLLSIHGNASTSASSQGVETFFLATRAANRRIGHLAELENEGRQVPQGPQGDDPLDRVLAGLSLDHAHRESQALALRVQHTLQRRLHSRGRGVLQAPFWLLWHADMPAVLVEVGFLSHPRECVQLLQAAHREKIAAALSTAVLAHLATYALVAAEP